MERCRGLGRRRTLLLVVLVHVMGSALSQAVPSLCPAGAAPHSLEQPVYEATVKPEGDFMAPFVQSFLNTVQPRPFPKDLVLEVVKDPGNTLNNQEFIREVLLYEVGFLVCVAIGILYIILMPIVGLFLACCRCCGNCGGKMHQKQTSSIDCRRRALYWAAFITTVIILAGNVCMFRSNESLKVSVDDSTVELNKAINNINIYLTAVPQQVQYVVNESYVTIQAVTNNLDAIGPQLGSEIQKQFESTFTSALGSIVTMDQEVVNTGAHLNNLNTSLTKLESSGNEVQTNLTALKKQINSTLSNLDCVNCANVKPELDKLTLDTSVKTPVLNELQTELNEVIKADLNSKVKEVEAQFKDIPQTITSDTQEIVQSSKTQLEEIKSQISKINSELPLSGLDDIKAQLKQVQSEISRYRPEVERAEYIRWCVCIALCCVVLLVVVCNLLGLILGPLGLKSKVEPTKRSCASDCGGTFFMMGAGFSFLFCWLFMILVLLLFLVGGNAYTLLCKTWNNGELLQLIDTPGVIPNFDLSATFGTNVTVSGIYRDCEANKPAWSAFHLDQKINLDDLLNVSKYTDEIKKNFEDADIKLSPVTFLTPEVITQLNSFSSKANDVDFTALVQQINSISRINLNTTADKLDELAKFQTSGQIQQELKSEAQSLRQIQSNIENTIFPQMTTVNSTLNVLRATVGRVNATVGEVLFSVGVAQDFYNKNATQIVKTESGEFLDCQLRYFTALAEWADMTITQEMARCGPVAGAVDSAEIIVCYNAVEALNAFWFSLGWCMIFLIPSVIFSIKLAKYYRKMKYTDVFDDHIQMNYIPRAQMKFS